MLTNAFIIEREDGTVVGYNCSVKRRGNTLTVLPTEKQIGNIHCNLIRSWHIKFNNKIVKVPTAYIGWTYGVDLYN